MQVLINDLKMSIDHISLKCSDFNINSGVNLFENNDDKNGDHDDLASKHKFVWEIKPYR